MKIVTQAVAAVRRRPYALASGLLLTGIVYACATPVEIEGCQPPGTQNCDVIISQASDFGDPDASVPLGQGGNAGSGSNPPPGGGAGSGNPPPGGNAGSSAGSGSAGSGSAGSSAGSGNAGSGNAGASGAGSGGAAGSGSAGSGSAGSSAGSGSAGSGSAGTGSGGTGAQSQFNPASCDFTDTTGCEDLGCICAEERCQARCTNIVTCLQDNITCITEADPLCAIRNNGAVNTCTQVVETGGGVNADLNQPAGIVRALVNCVCSDPRPQ